MSEPQLELESLGEGRFEHQDAADLPRQVDGEQVIAAYDDAVQGILARRGMAQDV